MYLFWNVHGLAQHLREQRVTQQQQWGYLFVWICVVCPMYLGIRELNPQIPTWLIRPLVTAVGLLMCLQANERGDGQHLVSRVICLGIPVGFRVFVCVYVPAYLIVRMLDKDSLTIYLSLIMQVIYFWRLQCWIESVSGGKPCNETVCPQLGLEQSKGRDGGGTT